MGRSRRRRRTPKFTKGDANRLIDKLLHSRFSENVGFIFLDGLLHACVENSPEESLRKFVRYNVPALLREAVRKRRRRHV